MSKTEFLNIVADGINRDKRFMCVKIETEGSPGPEIIINAFRNYDEKISYYKSAYNEDMELISAKKTGKLIRITDVLMTSNLNDLSWFAY